VCSTASYLMFARDPCQSARVCYDACRLLDQQYQGKLAAEWARWQGVRSAQQAQQQEQVQQECSAALQDMVQLAAVVGQHGGLVDHKLLAQLRAQLHTSFAAGALPLGTGAGANATAIMFTSQQPRRETHSSMHSRRQVSPLMPT
jgi:hypothetical protein